MERSSELRDLMLRFYEALSSGDASFFDRHFSRADGVRGIGTDPQEWWEDGRVAVAWKDQLQAMGGRMPLFAGDPQAFSEGSVGWVADRPALKVGAAEVQVRLTAVFHREDEVWKLVQCHGSIGVPNEDPADEAAA